MQIFEKAWGNYVAMFEFLTQSEFDDARGMMQTYNLASLLSYDNNAPNYNNFLLLNAANYVGPTTPDMANADQSEPGGSLEHGTTLVDAYQSFLESFDERIAKAIEPSEEAEHRRLEQDIDRAQREFENYMMVVDDKWADYLEAHPEIEPDERRSRRIEWERDLGYSQRLQRRRNKVRRVNAKLNAFLRSRLSEELGRVITARTYFDDENYWVDLPVAAQHDDHRFHYLWRKFRMQLPLLSIDEFLTNSSIVRCSFSTVEEHHRRVETHWKAKAKARWGIFSGGGSAERRKMEELTTTSEFSCDLSFARFEEVEIFRDRWYQPILFETIGKDLREFWGPSGLLACIPTSLLLARGMKLEVKVGESYRRELEKFFRSGGKMSFGPFFSAGGSYSRDERSMDYTKTGEGFLLEDGENTIRLLGGRVRRHNWNEADALLYHSDLTMSEARQAHAVLSGAAKQPDAA